MGDVLQIIGAFFVVVGAVFCVIGGIGVVRLPDFYSRCHGSGMTDSAGAGALLLGLMCFAEPLVAFKLLILAGLWWGFVRDDRMAVTPEQAARHLQLEASKPQQEPTQQERHR